MTELARGSVVTIGSYDGLHLGHQQLLESVKDRVRTGRIARSIVMSFEPTPKEFFQADRPPARLMRFREKYDALRAKRHRPVFYCPRFQRIHAGDFGGGFYSPDPRAWASI